MSLVVWIEQRTVLSSSLIFLDFLRTSLISWKHEKCTGQFLHLLIPARCLRCSGDIDGFFLFVLLDSLHST